MTDISIGAGFVTPQNVQASMPVQQIGSNPSSGSFMQSLQQNKSVDTDIGLSGNAANGSAGSVSSSAAQTAADASSENAVSQTVESTSDTYDASASGEAGSAYETAQKVEYTSSGNVKVDEEAVKELNDLSQNAKDKIIVTDEKPSLLEQAKDALEKAMLKAFKDLNDPEKEKEEFEEKALIFLMKLVDKINGKTEKKTALNDDKDEDEEKIGGALLQIIDSMLKNAEKNAEENGVVGVEKDEWIEDTDFVDSASSEDTARRILSINLGSLYAEPIPTQAPIPENYRIYNPLTPRVQSVGSGNISDGRDNSQLDLGLDANVPLTAEAVNDTVGVNQAEANNTVFGQENVISTEIPAVMTEANAQNVQTAQTENTVNVDLSKAAQTENPVSVPATAQVIPETENQPANSFDFGRPEENSIASYAEGAETMTETAAEASDYTGETVIPQTSPEAASAQLKELSENVGEEGIPNLQAREASEPNESPTVLQTAENEEYEQIAQNIFKQVTETVKAVLEVKVHEENAEASIQLNAPEKQEETEDEFEELARLFGMKKKEKKPELPEEEEEQAETVRPVKRDEAVKVPVEEISTVSSKITDVPVARAFEPTENGVKQIVTQIVSEVLNNLPEEGGETTVMMTLNPETLGRISVKLVENAGKISVTITAESKETAAILASRAESMQESMRDSGTQLEKYQVVYGAEQDGRAEQQNYDGSSKNPYVREVEEHDDENEGQFAEILGNEAV